MNFTEAVAEVVATTKRPDKIVVARRKVNAAISFYSLDNEFARDFTEELIAIDSAEYTQAISLTDLTRFRKVKYIKRGGTTKFFNKLPDSELFKDCDKRDTFYVVGDNININTSVLCSSVDIGYWQYPPLLDDTVTNRDYWLLEVAPFMIIDRACGEIFRDIGEEKSFQSHMQAARDSYMAARKDLGISTQ